MSQLIIDVHDPEDEELLIKLATKLNATVVRRSAPAIPKPESSESPVDILRQIAARGGATSYGDASEWQRRTREEWSTTAREE